MQFLWKSKRRYNQLNSNINNNMEFKKYQHLERFGTTEVQNIELGELVN